MKSECHTSEQTVTPASPSTPKNSCCVPQSHFSYTGAQFPDLETKFDPGSLLS